MSEITLSIPDESLSLNETLGQLLSDAFGQLADIAAFHANHGSLLPG